MYDDCTLSLYAIFCAAHFFLCTLGLFLCCTIKSPPEWQMVDLSSWGMRTEGREDKKKSCPTVTKVFGVRGQESICSGLRGHCFAGRDLLP